MQGRAASTNEAQEGGSWCLRCLQHLPAAPDGGFACRVNPGRSACVRCHGVRHACRPVEGEHAGLAAVAVQAYRRLWAAPKSQQSELRRELSQAVAALARAHRKPRTPRRVGKRGSGCKAPPAGRRDPSPPGPSTPCKIAGAVLGAVASPLQWLLGV
ncbi:predicted protein [Aspergillus terreus NIH2624]|uniref:Uncharacterized protein n=1 Tax=Aspergillus terreus (strain NIH 2624 / FGSC A1156) TaxID=341663 RepID=Q0CCW7_ASPTN|nr:uncharacterized protein ATEG_08467 [Aspergillus terreus NIH2624]EAU31640.1 predicted protein [Aspergillus terreus NIH2624]